MKSGSVARGHDQPSRLGSQPASRLSREAFRARGAGERTPITCFEGLCNLASNRAFCIGTGQPKMQRVQQRTPGRGTTDDGCCCSGFSRPPSSREINHADSLGEPATNFFATSRERQHHSGKTTAVMLQAAGHTQAKPENSTSFSMTGFRIDRISGSQKVRKRDNAQQQREHERQRKGSSMCENNKGISIQTCVRCVTR